MAFFVLQAKAAPAQVPSSKPSAPPAPKPAPLAPKAALPAKPAPKAAAAVKVQPAAAESAPGADSKQPEADEEVGPLPPSRPLLVCAVLTG